MLNRVISSLRWIAFLLGLALIGFFPITSVAIEPSEQNSGTLKNLKFAATMNTGWRPAGNAPICNPCGDHLRFESWGLQVDHVYLFFDEYSSYLISNGFTSNQIVSAQVVFTWRSGRFARPDRIQLRQVAASWTENITSLIGTTGQTSSGQEVASLTPGSQYGIDARGIVVKHLSGEKNYGFHLIRATGSTTREEDFPEGAPRFHTRLATDPNLRPYLEVVVDTSRPRYPAPTDAPQGLSISAGTGAVTASWTSTPANTESVRIDINCSSSGSTSSTVSASVRSITRTNLKSGERCSARAASINDGGSSPLSMSTSEVVVTGTAPASPPVSRLAIASNQATVTLSGVASDATEVQVTLSCSSSGQRSTTIASSQQTATFTGLTTGENCSAYALARNQWGSSPQGAASNSELVRGQAPSAMTFISESPISNQLRISWPSAPANTSTVDLVLSCQSTGRITRSLSPNDRQAVISDLKPGEQCTPSITLTNQWGSSPTTTNPPVVIRGSSPSAPSISNIDLSTPQQVVVSYLIPTGAASIDLYLRCQQAGTNSLLGLPSSRTSATFTNAIAGDRCSLSAQAKNEWGTSAESSASSQFIIQGPRPEAPSDSEIKSDVEFVRINWNNGTGASQTQVTLECTKSGTRTFLVSVPTKTQAASALGGELCSAILISKNQWGESRNAIRTQSVLIQSKAVTQPSNPTIQVPKNTASKPPAASNPPKVSTPNTKPGTTTTGNKKKKSSIVCIKGGAQQTVTAVKPKCPNGWIKKPEVVKTK
jgi:hypothetical protein